MRQGETIAEGSRKMPKFGMIHYNTPGDTLEELLDYAQETGYEYLELRVSDIWDEKNDSESEAARRAETVREMLEKRGLKASAVSAGNDFVIEDEETIRAQVERMHRICRLAGIVGTNVLRTEGGAPKDTIPRERWVDAMAGCLRRCCEFAEPEGYYLAVDNHGLVTNDADLQVELYRKVGSDHVGANLDTMNYRWAGHDLDTVKTFYEKIAPYVMHTHLKDGIGCRAGYRGTVLGKGEIDLRYAVQCLKDTGYGGVWCVEYEGRDDPAEGYRQGLMWMKENI